jgi:hypothetical protein
VATQSPVTWACKSAMESAAVCRPAVSNLAFIACAQGSHRRHRGRTNAKTLDAFDSKMAANVASGVQGRDISHEGKESAISLCATLLIDAAAIFRA